VKKQQILSRRIPKKNRRNANSHSAIDQKSIDSVCRPANLRLHSFLVSFRGEFFGHGFLELFSINSVAFGGVHESVIAARAGSLISRIQQADLQKQLAKLGLVVGAYLRGQKLLRGRGVFLRPLPCAASPEPELGPGCPIHCSHCRFFR
jgi:hypothetical protein